MCPKGKLLVVRVLPGSLLLPLSHVAIANNGEAAAGQKMFIISDLHPSSITCNAPLRASASAVRGAFSLLRWQSIIMYVAFV